MNKYRFQYCASCTMFYILFSTFLYLFIIKTHRESLWNLSQQLKQFMESLNSADELNLDGQLPEVVEVVFPINYSFRLNEPEKCLERTPFLVLFVTTEPKDANKRYAIRQTWGNENSFPDVAIICLFLSGLQPIFDSTVQKHLEEESTLYRDIIQQDFLDTYNNLTLKTLMGMEWISKFCPEAAYVMKVDSDVFLNVHYLVLNLLQPHKPLKKNYVTGFIHTNNKPIRNKKHKWYMPLEMYTQDTFPPYCAGPGYVLSGDLANKIYQVAQTTRIIKLEDAFMGICLHKLRVKVRYSRWGLFNLSKIKYEKCRFSKLVIVHNYRPEELLKIWPDFQKQKKC